MDFFGLARFFRSRAPAAPIASLTARVDEDLFGVGSGMFARLRGGGAMGDEGIFYVDLLSGMIPEPPIIEKSVVCWRWQSPQFTMLAYAGLRTVLDEAGISSSDQEAKEAVERLVQLAARRHPESAKLMTSEDISTFANSSFADFQRSRSVHDADVIVSRAIHRFKTAWALLRGVNGTDPKNVYALSAGCIR